MWETGLSQTQLLLGLSFLAGGLHVLSPDHWFAVSVFSWQKRWRLGRAALFASLVFLAHLIAGALLFFVLPKGVVELKSGLLFLLSLGLVMVFVVLRALHFDRVIEVVRSGGQGRWALMTLLSLIGPCEFLLPILIKSAQLQVEPLLTFGAFSAGTLLFGNAITLWGHHRWSVPFALPRGLRRAYQGSTLLPLTAGVLAGLALIVQTR